MKALLKTELAKLIRQKYFYIFTAGFLLLFICYGYLLTNPMLSDSINVNSDQVGGANFPEYMLQFYASFATPLFMAFITSHSINQERQSNIFWQPLMHGILRAQLLLCKLIPLCLSIIALTIISYALCYLVSFIYWGAAVIAVPVWSHIAVKYFLVCLTLLTAEIGIILIALLSPNNLITIAVSFGLIITIGFLSMSGAVNSHLALLHGFSRVEILHVNLLLLMLCAITFLLYFHAIAFLCGLFAWGSEMLTVDAVLHTLFQDLLLAFPLCTFCVAIVLLCLYTKDSVSVIAFSFIALLLDNLVNQFYIESASKLSFLFYIYGYSEFNGHQLESIMNVYGILLSVFTAILLYVFANRKMKSIEL